MALADDRFAELRILGRVQVARHVPRRDADLAQSTDEQVRVVLAHSAPGRARPERRTSRHRLIPAGRSSGRRCRYARDNGRLVRAVRRGEAGSHQLQVGLRRAAGRWSQVFGEAVGDPGGRHVGPAGGQAALVAVRVSSTSTMLVASTVSTRCLMLGLEDPDVRTPVVVVLELPGGFAYVQRPIRAGSATASAVG